MSNQTYYNGDFWQCVTDTNPGETPASEPTKWRKLRIPKEWRRVLAKLTYTGLLELDGQTDKAAEHRELGEEMLDDLVRQAANREEQAKHGGIHTPQGGNVAASVILDDAYRLMRWSEDLSQLEDSQKEDARMSLSTALQEVWDAWWWGSLMLLAEVAMKPVWDASTFYKFDPATFNLATEIPAVYYPATRKYYQPVQPVKGIPPESLVNGAYVLNSQFWAECKDRYAGADVDNTQAYSYGTQLRNPDDGLYYQRSGSIQVTAAGAAEALGIYVPISTNTTALPIFYLGPQNDPSVTVSNGTYFRAVPVWLLTVQDLTPTVVASYTQADATTPNTPDLVRNWTVTTGSAPGPTIATAFVAPACPDPGSWGLLTPFDHILSLNTTVRSVSKQNPTVSHNPENFHFDAVDGGVRVRDWHHNTAWVWSRRVTPIITGDEFDSTATYEATPENEIVFDS